MKDEKTVDTNKKTIKYESEGKNPMHYAQRTLLQALVVVIVVWLLFGHVFGIMTAPNGDMFPRIDSGDLLLYYRLDKSIEAGDVIVFSKNKTTYIGRVVARPGDVVNITEQNQLVINQNVITERNIFFPTSRYEGFNQYPVSLKKDEYFVLVDMREKGEDSRYFGPVSKKEIKGNILSILRRINF